MYFRLSKSAQRVAWISYFALLLAPSVLAQNSILLFGPVDKRLSTAGTGFGANAVNFNSNTLNLTCPAQPTGVVSSSADATGNVLVDDFITVTSTAGATTTGPTNVCPGGGTDVCFASGYLSAAPGTDPDTILATGGVAPINVSQFLVPGPVQLQIATRDNGSGPGFYLASSTLYLDTNCSQNGVTGPALVTGNPISGTNPTPAQLAQDFSFNPTTGQGIGFEYDLTTAESDGNLLVVDGTIPQVNDSPIDPAIFQSNYVPQTSFATSNCLIHTGELLPNGQPACKLFTLECKIGAGGSPTGAQCPISTQNDEIFRDVFDGPVFSLSDIPTPGGPTFHEGIGFLMASEGWGGGPCTFDPAAKLDYLPCPQNLLTSFTSAAVPASNIRGVHAASPLANPLSSRPRPAVSAQTSGYTSSGRTTHPNSTFITVAQVPEDLTTITVAGQQSGNWINNSTANVTLSSQPPNLSGTTLPGAASFVASPIQSITYGLSPAGSVPAPGSPVPTDTTLDSGVVCPTLANPTGVPASTFTPAPQQLKGLADGQYLLHYYAQDCAGTQELQFNQDSSGNWTTSFYTYPINVDTTPPVAATPTLSPAASAQGTYPVGTTVMATFSCSDSLSGVTTCGGHTYSPATNSTGPLTAQVDTSSPGLKTFTVQAVDAAGNQSSASVTYQVVSGADKQVQFSVNPQTVNYPQGTEASIQILPGAASSIAVRRLDRGPANGTVSIFDGSTLLGTTPVEGDFMAHFYIHGLAVGQHPLTAAYSGNGTIPGGTSAPAIFTVKPAPVNLQVYCRAFNLSFGSDITCGAVVTYLGGPVKGSIAYSFDNGAPVTVALDNWGIAVFTIKKPALGAHTVVVSFAAQTNFAAATPVTENFKVTPGH